MSSYRTGIFRLGFQAIAGSPLRIAVMVAALGAPHFAAAQDADKKKDNTLAEVVVTGSRIQRSTFNTPNPVTVVGAQDIENLGLVNVGEVLAQIPQNSNFFAANNVGLGNFNVGAQLANLRGLNPFFGTRTLTLIDSERVVPQATGGGVDVTLIPSMLVDRTEVVTGGASAVYGSDAVAGVVNIILNNKLDGWKAQVDYGQTSHSDGGSTHFSVGYGSALGDRAHYVLGAEYQDSKSIGICSQVRSWCRSQQGLFTNTLFAGHRKFYIQVVRQFRPTDCRITSSAPMRRSRTRALPVYSRPVSSRHRSAFPQTLAPVSVQCSGHCGHTLRSRLIRGWSGRVRLQPGRRARGGSLRCDHIAAGRKALHRPRACGFQHQ